MTRIATTTGDNQNWTPGSTSASTIWHTTLTDIEALAGLRVAAFADHRAESVGIAGRHPHISYMGRARGGG